MGKVTKKEMPLWAQTGHKKPVTRREFMAHGIIPFAASALVPGALGLLAAPFRAQAADPECPSGGSGMVPFITLHLSGGAGLSANVVPRLASGDPLPSYTQMGLGNNSGANALSWETEFGQPVFPKLGATQFSQMLVQIRANCDPATLANTAMFSISAQSQDDTSNNKYDASGLVYKAGLVGSLIPNLGTQPTLTGVNNQPATITPPRPLEINSFGDLANSIGYTRALVGPSGLTAPQQSKLARLVASLSNSQAEKFAQINSTAGVKTLVECAGIKNIGLVGQGAGAITPANNAQYVARWGLTAASYVPNAASQDVIFSSMVYNGLMGNAGTIALDIGGYDYHNGTRTLGDTKDGDTGRYIGRILDSARILGKKVFLFVNTDGSVQAQVQDAPGAIWTSDRGSSSLSICFMYDPAGRPATIGFSATNPIAQIGHFTAGQIADASTPVGGNTEMASQAVFANYLKFAGKEALFDKVIPRGTLDMAKVMKVA